MNARGLVALVFFSDAAAQDLFGDLQPESFVDASVNAAVPITLLSLETGARALDGSQYGFYFVPSATGSRKWTIYFQGGGWCDDEDGCLSRANSTLGSSTFLLHKNSGCPCMNTANGGLDETCNCLFLPYLDGASFSGYREEPWPVPNHPGEVVYFRGLQNLDSTLDYAFAQLGLDQATEVVVTGGSAGGLSTFLHADRIADRVKAGAKDCKRTTAAPTVGYFIDHPKYPSSTWKDYTSNMAYVYKMQNLTAGALLPECLVAFPESPHYCFMSPHMQQFIQTPFFMFNSKVDAWQMGNILQVPCLLWHQHNCTEDEQAAVLEFADSFMDQFAPVAKEPQNGAFITSCICHGCGWNTLTLDNKTAYQHYADWHAGIATGPAAIHVDSRGPNGDGALDSHPQCTPYPGPPGTSAVTAGAIVI